MARRHAALAALVALAVACSSKKDDSPPPSTCGTASPVAAATATPASVEPVVGVVQLAATSTDADDACLASPELRTYLWRVDSRPLGSSAVVSDPASPSPTFTPDVPGEYQLDVVATDEEGHESTPAFVNVSASACSELAPTVSVLASVGGTTFGAVTLPQPVVADSNCLATGAVSYRWTLLSRPASSDAVLSDPAAARPVLVPDAVGPYQLSVVVTSSVGIESAPAFVTVSVAPCGSAAPVLPALVASPAVPNAGELVTLGTGGGVADPNESACGYAVQPFRYRWVLLSRPAGSSATLSSDTAAGPSFVADVPNGVYQLSLTVTDAIGNESAPAFLSVIASSCGANAPVVAFSPPAVGGTANSAIALTAALSDADDTSCPAAFATAISRVEWSVAGQPVGSHPALASSATIPPPGASTTANTLVGDVAGTYVVEAVATATNGMRSAPAQATVTVSPCGTSAPTITQVQTVVAGALTSRPPVGTDVTLVAASFDADSAYGGTCGMAPEPQPTEYAWTLVSAPAGSQVAAPAWTQGSTFAFTPDVAGTFVFGVTVRDVHGLVSAPVEVTVPTGSCGPDVEGVATSSSTPTVGDTVQASIGSISDVCVAGGLPPTISWSIATRPAGSSAVLTGAATATPTFVPDAPGVYTLQVVVTDAGGYSTLRTIDVVAGGCTSAPTISGSLSADQIYSAFEPGGAPSAPAGAIYRDDRVQLGLPSVAIAPGTCGAATSTTYSWQWALVSRPAGSQAQLSFANGPTPSFVADVPGGTYQVMVAVTDANGNTSAPALFALAASDCGGRAPAPSFAVANPNPDANAPDVLSALVSDPEATCPVRFQNVSGAWTYAWAITSQPQGSHASLSPAAGPSVSFQADTAGSYAVKLTATSFDGTSGSVQQSLVVNACGTNPPVASSFSASQYVFGATLSGGSAFLGGSTYAAGAPLDTGVPVILGATVTDLDASATCGLMPQATSWQWSLVSVPAASRASLANASMSTPDFTPDVPGTYAVQLRTSDPLGNASTAIYQVTAGVCGSQAPTVAATGGITASQTATNVVDSSGSGSPIPLAIGYPVQLSVTYADADASCAPPIPNAPTFAWTMTGLPAGSTAQLLGASTSAPSFVPDVPGQYAFTVVVTDAQGHASAPQTIFLQAQCGAAPPQVATTNGGFLASQTVANVLPAPGAARSTLTILRASDVYFPGQIEPTRLFYVGFPVQVSASVTDPDLACGLSQTFSYAWSFLSLPAGSHATLNDPGVQAPSFTPDVPGAYALRVVVTDSTGRSTTADLSARSDGTPLLNVGTCGSAANAPIPGVAVTAPFPVAAAFSSAAEPKGTSVLLDASSTTAPNLEPLSSGGCGLPGTLSWWWTIAARPPTSSAWVSNSGTANPSFTPDVDGSYGVQVQASDGRASATAVVTVRTTPSAVAPLSGTAPFVAATVDDASGQPVVAWIDPGPTSAIRVARCTANCAGPAPTWTTLPEVDELGPTPFTWSGKDDPRPLDVKASGGSIWVAYGTGPVATLNGTPSCAAAMARWNGASWTPSWFVSGSGCDSSATAGSQAGRWMTVALHSGVPAFAFTYGDVAAGQSSVWYGECSDATCPTWSFGTKAAFPNATSGRWPTLSVDDAGIARLAFSVTGMGGSPYSLAYSECPGGWCPGATFTTVLVANGAGGDQGRYARLALDPLGRPRIAYQRGSTGLQLAQCDGSCTSATSWTARTVDSSASAINGVGLGFAIDDAGRYTLATVDPGSSLLRLAAAPDGATFSGSAQFGATGQPAVAATPGGGAAIAVSSDQELRFVLFGQ